MTEHVAFIGKKTVTPAERAALVRLGQTLAADQMHLHIALQGEASLALLTAFRAAGGKSTVHQKDLHKSAKDMIVFADDTLIDQIMTRYPADTSTQDWVLIDSPELLEKAISHYEAHIQEAKTA